MSYEEECDWYALYGNPERDAMDYELMAEYDRYDGYREDLRGVHIDCDEYDYLEEEKNIQPPIPKIPVEPYNHDIPF